MKYVSVFILSMLLFCCQSYASSEAPGDPAIDVQPEREYVTDPTLPTATPGVIKVEKNTIKEHTDGEEAAEDFSVMEVTEEKGTAEKAWDTVKEKSAELVHLIREASWWSDKEEQEVKPAEDTEEEVVSQNE